MGYVNIIKASAGAGKTYRLTYEYVRNVIDDPYLYRHILAVTFTNKATEEMKRRILSEINDLAQGVRNDGKGPAFLDSLISDLSLDKEQIKSRAILVRTLILHDYSRFAVLTIDKFFQQIIRAFVREIGMDTNFSLELNRDIILADAATLLLESVSEDKVLKDWVVSYIEEQLSEGRTWEIKNKLTAIGAEIFNENFRPIAESISKKELSDLFLRLNQKTSERKEKLIEIARSGIDYIDNAGLSLDDFPYGAAGAAGYFYKIASGNLVAYGKRVSDAIDNPETLVSKKSPKQELIRSYANGISDKLKMLYSEWESFAKFWISVSLIRENFRSYVLLSDLDLQIKKICKSNDIMLLSETTKIINRLIGDNDAPFIYEKIGNRFTHFMIDEFQDTSEMQWENFYPLLKNAVSESSESPVLIVGDVKQSIYRWRGGKWQILGEQIQQQFDSINTEVLAANYRSKGAVVNFNNSVIKGCVEECNTSMNGMLEDARTRGIIEMDDSRRLHNMVERAYDSFIQQSVKPEHEGYIKIYKPDFFKEKLSENEGDLYTTVEPTIIADIEDLQRRGYQPRDIAILVRSNKEGAAVADMLIRRKTESDDFCYDIVSQEELLISSSPVTGFIIACFRLSLDVEDSINRGVVMKYLSRSMDSLFEHHEAEFISSLKLKTLEEAFESIVSTYKLGENPDNVAYLQALNDQVIAFSSGNVSDVYSFLEWWDETGFKKTLYLPSSQNAITIITIHKAKGLQYKAVILPFCSWGLAPRSKDIVWTQTELSEFKPLEYFPVSYKKDFGESFFAFDYYKEYVLSYIDNLNTLYVALTRAEDELHIMIPTEKSNSVGDMILNNIDFNIQAVEKKDDDKICEFGVPPVVKSVADKQNAESIIFDKFDSYSVKDRVKLKLKSEKYIVSQEGGVVLSPRNYGVLMHKVFESIKYRNDIEPMIDLLYKNGDITFEVKEKLSQLIAESLKDEIIASWFDEKWQVLNESSIVLPERYSSKYTSMRPDRVLLNEDSAVIIDYKFGEEDSAYKKQISSYASLIRDMGYKDVKAYLWYVEQGEVEKVI